MEINECLNGVICDVTLRGRFTFADHAAFRALLPKIRDNTAKTFVFRMAQVEFIDSAALGMLLLARDEAEKHHKSLIISGITGQVKKVFNMARFDTLFTME